MVTEREQLNRMLNDSLHDVEDSRRRLATAAATERRRIERDLHDGAQQRLVTLRVQLELAEEELRRDPVAGTERLRELGPSIDAAIDDVRSLAGGIYPPLLADAGLAEALRAAALRQALTVTVDADHVVRYSVEVESAAYFCCLEALQNAAKHSGAAEATVTINSDPNRLRFTVADLGCGFARNGHNGGAGLTNMRDRLAAVGGRIEIDSRPGRGTRVTGDVPVAADA
jgi:signal transduction histidine kinase